MSNVPELIHTYNVTFYTKDAGYVQYNYVTMKAKSLIRAQMGILDKHPLAFDIEVEYLYSEEVPKQDNNLKHVLWEVKYTSKPIVRTKNVLAVTLQEALDKVLVDTPSVEFQSITMKEKIDL